MADVKALGELLAVTKVEDEVELSFSGRSLKLDTENDAVEIVNAIKNSSRMTALKLEGNTVGVLAAKAIAKALESHPEMKRALWRDMFTGRLKTEIPEALTYLSGGLILANAHLAELDLSDNAFGAIGVDGIEGLLTSPTCYSLKELKLNNNGLGIGGGKNLAKALIQCHQKSVEAKTPLALTVFICGRNRLENDGAKALSEFFKIVRTLQEVQMPQNGIYHEGITAIAEALANNPGLRHLNLNDNTFTEVGAESMTKVLPKLQNLEIINFGDCLLRGKGAKLLGTALTGGHINLKELVLESNEIDQEGAFAIVDSMENKPHLTKLELNSNSIGDESCKLLEGMMETIGHADVLGSLSDDDGEDENDEDENSDDYEDEEEEVDAHRYRSPLKSGGNGDADTRPTVEIVTPPKLATVQQEKCLLQEFLDGPSVSKFLWLRSNYSSWSRELDRENMTFNKYLDIFTKVAMLSGNGDDNLKTNINQCADIIMSRAFSHAEADNSLPMFSNMLLEYLGLIKSEDKKFQPLKDLSGQFIVLEHAIRQKYFPRATKEILQFFLSRPHKAVEATGNIKHKLMQALYRC